MRISFLAWLVVVGVLQIAAHGRSQHLTTTELQRRVSTQPLGPLVVVRFLEAYILP